VPCLLVSVNQSPLPSLVPLLLTATKPVTNHKNKNNNVTFPVAFCVYFWLWRGEKGPFRDQWIRVRVDEGRRPPGVWGAFWHSSTIPRLPHHPGRF
jgi:hypothetical protein